jgi:hypothetical protein
VVLNLHHTCTSTTTRHSRDTINIKYLFLRYIVYMYKLKVLLVSNQFSPGTSSHQRTCSCCVNVSTADFIYASNSTIAGLLKYHLNNVLATCNCPLFMIDQPAVCIVSHGDRIACWRELVHGENWSLASTYTVDITSLPVLEIYCLYV